MSQNIEQYLSQLKKELSGCDRATIQDALSDAEEHLRTALTSAMADADILEDDAILQIIEEYGTPEEVAAESIAKCQQGGPNGYILAAGDMVPPATPLENLQAMVDVALKSLWK